MSVLVQSEPGEVPALEPWSGWGTRSWEWDSCSLMQGRGTANMQPGSQHRGLWGRGVQHRLNMHSQASPCCGALGGRYEDLMQGLGGGWWWLPIPAGWAHGDTLGGGGGQPESSL